MSDLSPSSLKLTPKQEQQIAEAPSGEIIKSLLADFALEQGLVERDSQNPSVLLEKPSAQTVSTTIKVNGVKKTFTGTSADDLQKQEIAFYKSLETENTEPPRDDATGRFTANQGKADETAANEEEAKAAEIIRRSNLEIEFRAGRLSSADYLAQTGAIEEHLAAQGIDVEVLKAHSAERTEAAKYQQSWASATQDFLRSPAGADWPGGEANKARIASIIEQIGKANPDIEKENKSEVLAHAWSIMKRNDAQTKAILDAKSPEEIRDALGINSREVRGSSVFGR